MNWDPEGFEDGHVSEAIRWPCLGWVQSQRSSASAVSPSERTAGRRLRTSSRTDRPEEPSCSSGLNAMCSAEFQASHLCTTTEYQRAGSKLAPPTAAAWIQPAGVMSSGAPPYRISYAALASSGPFVYGDPRDCTQWTSVAGSSLTLQNLSVSGGNTYQARACSEAHPLACCR
jgi:hypothetical protein